jgi:hypothetical protein
MVGVCVGVVVPTRGLIFTEAISGILSGFEGIDHHIYMSHDLPTPDSFNSLIKAALDDGCDYIYITNDDVVVNKTIIRKLFDAKADIAFCPTYIKNFPGYYEKNGEVSMIGTSCVLVKREAMEKIYPLRTDKTYLTVGDEEMILDKPQEFGGEEVWFSRQALKYGYKMVKIDDKARHLRLITLGEHRSNHGCHEIGEA